MAQIRMTRADELKVGDLLDLEGDPYGDNIEPDTGERNPTLIYEYSQVGEIVRETPECIVIYSEHSAFGCPPDHRVKVAV